MLRMKPLALALSVVVLPSLSWAQTEPVGPNEVSRTLSPVEVTAGTGAAGDLSPGYAGGQVARGGRLGLLGNRDVVDTPFNITSYTAELIRNQQAKTVAEVLGNDPSVRFTTSGGHAFENFLVRGFDVHSSDLAINGLYGLAPLGSSTLEFVERVEVPGVKGCIT